MNDLVERLRDRYSKHSQELRDEAADEIEWLQRELIACWAELDEDESLGDLTRTDRREDNALL